jgi:hypothetical protein
MKKVLLLALFAMFVSVFAHGVLLLVDTDGDGKIFIEAGLSTGGTAAGAEVIIKEKASGRPILTTTYPEKGPLTVEQPTVAYTVTVSLSEGHSVTRSGPVASAKPANSKAAPASTVAPASNKHFHNGVECKGH